MPTENPPRLEHPLPPDTAVHGWLAYRHFPVFGSIWLRRRALVFLPVIAVMALLSGTGAALASGDYLAGAGSALRVLLAFTVIAFAGPAAATWIRTRGWPQRHERWWLVVAIAAGIAAGHVADGWASRHVARQLEGGLRPEMLRDSLTPGERALSRTVNTATLLAIYALAGGGVALRAYFGEQRRLQAAAQRREMEALRLRAMQSDLELGVLQAQIEPHFLFNTLASVRSLVRSEPARAEETLDALVDYLRAAIPRLREGAPGLASTLGQQLELVASYLALMQVRLGARFAWDVHVADPLRSAAFPPLMLITLVENAIKHGIEPKRGPGRIDIHAERDDAALVVRVVDDGVGVSTTAGGGLGLANIRAQLAARYGARARVRVESAASGGTVAAIRLPLEQAA